VVLRCADGAADKIIEAQRQGCLGLRRWIDDSSLQGFRDALGIASQSTVFADFGKWIIEVEGR
jgi:hypothetical protein